MCCSSLAYLGVTAVFGPLVKTRGLLALQRAREGEKRLDFPPRVSASTRLTCRCSASYAGLNEWEEAAHDAAECIKVNKNFVKGTTRLLISDTWSSYSVLDIILLYVLAK